MKLVIVLLNFVVGGAQTFAYLAMVCVGAMISIAIHYMRTRSFKGDIAFAPALCGAVLAVRPLSILSCDARLSLYLQEYVHALDYCR